MRTPLRRTLVLPAALVGALTALALPLAPAAAAGPALRLAFDAGESLAPGTRVVDSSGNGRDGTVRSGDGGRLTRVTGFAGAAARFPGPCGGPACPKALVEVPSAPGLVLGTAPFEWGTRLRLAASSTTRGQNLVQKGLYDDPAGQWKLQVDGLQGHPSCVVSGSRADGSWQRVTVTADVGVADGAWHRVLCRRTASGVAVLVDGRQHGYKAMRPVRLLSGAPVHVGGKWVDHNESDQFAGTLDDVQVQRL